METELTQNLRQRGLRITPLLKAVLDVFEESDAPLCVNDLTGLLKKRGLSPNKTTLYRLAAKLVEMEVLKENIFSDTIKKYCLVSGHHHHHFTCDQCGRVKEIPMKSCMIILKPLCRRLKKQGHRVSGHIMTLSGVCSHCLSAN